MRKGFVIIPLVIIISLIAVVGVSYALYKNSTTKNESDQISNSTSPTATSSPTPEPTPTLTPTPKPLPTKKPSTPTPRPTSTGTPCSQFVPENGLTSITINLKEKDGKPLAGDWIVKIKPTGSCPGILPPNWGGELNEVVRQPKYTYTSPGMHPGQYRVDVQYHYSGEGINWDGTSGSHSREVVVSN